MTLRRVLRLDERSNPWGHTCQRLESRVSLNLSVTGNRGPLDRLYLIDDYAGFTSSLAVRADLFDTSSYLLRIFACRHSGYFQCRNDARCYFNFNGSRDHISSVCCLNCSTRNGPLAER